MRMKKLCGAYKETGGIGHKCGKSMRHSGKHRCGSTDRLGRCAVSWPNKALERKGYMSLLDQLESQVEACLRQNVWPTLDPRGVAKLIRYVRAAEAWINRPEFYGQGRVHFEERNRLFAEYQQARRDLEME